MIIRRGFANDWTNSSSVRAPIRPPGVDGFSRAIVDGDHNNIGPRFGFAYQWSPKLVVRGGYGLFYGLRDQNQETTQFSGNNPNVPTLTFPVVDAQRTVTAPFAPGDVAVKVGRNSVRHFASVSLRYNPT